MPNVKGGPFARVMLGAGRGSKQAEISRNQLMGRQWAKRETQILSVIESTVGKVGDLQAIAGKAMPEIPSLDMPLLESTVEVERKAS